MIKQVHQKNVCFVIIGTLLIFGFKFQSHVRNKCHDVLMAAYELKTIAILNVKGVDFRCILWVISRFGGTYFRDIYCSANKKWYKKLWKEFDQLKNVDSKFYSSSCYDVSVNKYGAKCGTSLRCWKN